MNEPLSRVHDTEALEVDTPFRPRWPWLGADLQTVRNTLVRPRPDFAAYDRKELWFPLDDGTGDTLHGVLERSHSDSVEGQGSRPLVIVIHGLTGCHESFHTMVTAAALLAAGYPVLRVNLRGAGPTVGLCAEQYHAGRTDDFRTLLQQLSPELTADGVVALGYSLGGNMLLRYLGEAGESSLLRAAVSVSTPLDLAATSGRFHRRRNFLYIRYLLTRMKADTLKCRGGVPAELKAGVEGARSIVDYDDRYVAPRFGFASAADYYRRTSALPVLAAIRTPTLVIHALDDLWVSPDAYRDFDWIDSPALAPAVSARGGHVGFHGKGDALPWSDRLILAFLARL